MAQEGLDQDLVDHGLVFVGWLAAKVNFCFHVEQPTFVARMKKLTKLILIFGFVEASAIAKNAHPTVYAVNRSFAAYDNGPVATLTGTLEIPVGSYTIQNSSASPITDVNLTLTVFATSFHLFNALTGVIYGSGQFLICRLAQIPLC